MTKGDVSKTFDEALIQISMNEKSCRRLVIRVDQLNSIRPEDKITPRFGRRCTF